MSRAKGKAVCVICREKPIVGTLFCAPCGRSWDRDAERDCSMMAAILWTARRVWRIAAPKRKPRKSRGK